MSLKLFIGKILEVKSFVGKLSVSGIIVFVSIITCLGKKYQGHTKCNNRINTLPTNVCEN